MTSKFWRVAASFSVMANTWPTGIDAGKNAVLASVKEVAEDEIGPANVVSTLFAKTKLGMLMVVTTGARARNRKSRTGKRFEVEQGGAALIRWQERLAAL